MAVFAFLLIDCDIQFMKKTIASYFLAIIALSILWTGCDDCGPEADKNYVYELSSRAQGYVPYAIGDSFVMLDSVGNQLTYAVMTRGIAPVEDRENECSALETMDKLQVVMNKNLTANALTVSLQQMGKESEGAGSRLTVCIESACFSADLDSLGALKTGTSSGAISHNSLVVGNQNYLNVIELHRSNADSSQAHIVWYSTQQGVLRYQKLNGEIWSLP